MASSMQTCHMLLRYKALQQGVSAILSGFFISHFVINSGNNCGLSTILLNIWIMMLFSSFLVSDFTVLLLLVIQYI